MEERQCRICLEHAKCPFTLEDKIDERCVWAVICEIANVQISIDDNLPQNICLQCHDRLRDAFNFKSEIERSDLLLHNGDPEYLVQIKVEEIDVDQHANDNDDAEVKIVIQSEPNHSKRGRPRKQKSYEDFLTDIGDQKNELKEEFFNEEYLEIEQTDNENSDESEDDDDDVQEETDVKPKRLKKSPTDKEKKKSPVKKRRSKDSATQNQCCLCQENFEDESELLGHIEITHQQEIDDIVKQKYTKYTMRHKHECKYCHRKYMRKTSLPKHFTVNNYEEPHRKRSDAKKKYRKGDSVICTVCGKLYYDKYDLELHELRIHATERPIECPHPGCGKRFAAEILMRKHFKFHGERKHICEICGKGFIDASDLRNHSYVHKEIKPLQCPMCPRTFTHKPVLETHILSHTGENTYGCQQCDKVYKWKEDLRKHFMAEHLGIYPYKCKYCGKGYTGSSNRTYHEKRCSANFANKLESEMSGSILSVASSNYSIHAGTSDIPTDIPNDMQSDISQEQNLNIVIN